MPRATFIVPEVSTKVLTKYTLNVYKSKLNKLASEGITTPSDIIQNQDKVITIAKSATGGDKAKMRLFLSAVFYAVNDSPLEAKLKLYNEFQSCKDEPYQKFKSGELLITDEAEN